MSDPAGYTGREKFYALLNEIAISPKYSDLIGKLNLSVSDQVAFPAAPNHFLGNRDAYYYEDGKLAALYSLSPFVFSDDSSLAAMPGVAAARKELLVQGDLVAPSWLEDRQNLLVRKTWFNAPPRELLDSLQNDTTAGARNVFSNWGPYNPYAVSENTSSYPAFLSEAAYYEDIASGYIISQGPDYDHLPAATSRYIFGDPNSTEPLVSREGGNGKDHFYGGGGNDIFYGNGNNDLIYGGAGSDVLNGGAGEDIIEGGDGTQSVDTLRIVNLAPSEIHLFEHGPNLDIEAPRTEDWDGYTNFVVTILDYFKSPKNEIERIEFDNGTVLTNLDGLIEYGPSGTLFNTGGAYGSNGADVSNAEIFGRGGNDVLSGGFAQHGGTGDDILMASNSYGDAGDDILYAGGEGGTGNDIYLFHRGSGFTTIKEGGGALDIVRLGPGISPNDVRVSKGFIPNLQNPASDPVRIAADVSGSISRNLNLSIDGTQDTLVITGWFDGAIYQIEEVQFDSDNTVWNAATLETLAGGGADSTGTSNDPTAGGAILVGDGGNNVLTGDAGANIFYGDLGDDTLTGNAGNDTYVFEVGGGVDTIYDYASGGDVNMIVFGAGIDRSDITLGLGSLLLRVGDSGDAIHIANFNPNDVHAQPAISQFEFSNGEIYTYEDLIVDGFDLDGTQGDDFMAGTNVVDRMSGLDGNDDIHANAGDDWLNGGAGNDLLVGGAGDDIYFFGEGGGADTIDEAGALNDDFDSIELLTASSNVSVSRSGVGDANFVFLLNGSGDTLTVSNFDASGNRIEQVHFSDGVTWDRGQLLAEAPQGNRPPVPVIGIGNQSTFEDAAYSFTLPAGEFTDADVGDSLTLAATGGDGSALPTWLSFNAATRTFTATPVNADVGTVALKVVATDRAGASAYDSFNLSIININDAPTLVNGAGDQSTFEDAAFSFTLPTGEFADVDACDTLTVSAMRADGTAMPTWLSFDAATRTFTGTPTNADVGIVALTVVGTDGAGATAFDTFNLSVINTNDSPTIAYGVGDQSTLEDAVFRFTLPTGEFSDLDVGDALTIGATRVDGSALPSWLLFDAATRTFTGTPVNSDVGPVSLQVTATDTAGATAFDRFNLSVINTNDAPVAANDGFAMLENATTANFAPAVLANDSDPDIGDTRLISAVNANGTLGIVTFNLAAQTLVYAANASVLDALGAGVTATDAFSYTLSDAAGAIASASVVMTITGVNDAPTLNVQTAKQAATAGTPFSLTLSANTFSDVDAGDTLTYGAQLLNGAQLPSWLTFNAVTRTFSGTAANRDVGNYALKVIATDSGSLTATDAFTLTVGSGATGQSLIGTAGNDVLIGGAGNDTLDGRGGSDRLVGNDGDDTFKYFADGTWSSGYVAYNAGSPGNAGTGRAVAIFGKNRSFEVFEGGNGADVILGTASDDAIFLDDSFSAFPGGSVARIADVERIEGGAGNDVIDLTSNIYAYGNVTLDGGDGNDVLWTSSGNDVLLGGAGNDDLFGGAGQDYLDGGAGNDTLNGDRGNDLMEGSAGNDVLTDLFGKNLFYAKDGNDSLNGGDGNELFIGGAGNDSVVTGAGTDIIAFNRGDGHDAVTKSTGRDNTVSLGGGIRYGDLFLSKLGNNLVLQTAANEALTFTDWYAGNSNRSVLNLQMIVEGGADYAPGGTDVLRDNKIERFDFNQIAKRFDQAREAVPGNANHWAVMNSLLDAHLGNGSDSEALGGDLAYRYGANGTLAGIGINSAQAVLASSQFGSAPQALQPFAGLQDGLMKLG